MKDFYKKNKLAGLGVLYGVVLRFKQLFSQLEAARQEFSSASVKANNAFADLYFVTQRYILFKTQEYSEMAKKLKLRAELTAEEQERIGNALLEQVWRKIRTAANYPENLASAQRVAPIVKLLLPRSQEAHHVCTILLKN